MTLKLDLRLHASRITSRHARRRPSDAYFDSTDSVDLTVEYGTDAASFRSVNPNQGWKGSHTGIYGEDEIGVYFQYELIPEADPKTFVILNSDNALSRDKGHVYIRAEAYPQLDPASVRFLGEAGHLFYLSSGGEVFMFDQALDRLKSSAPRP